MTRRNPQVTQRKNIIKGRVFEYVLRNLITKAGFNLDVELEQMTKSKSIKKLHGRGSTYAPDFIGEFPMSLPFSYPFLLLGEAKYYSHPLGIKEVRAFLGAFIDISQYPRINTKSRSLFKYSQIFLGKRYNYIPVIFSSGGFARNAQALMWAHGIYFVSYENSAVFEDLKRKIEFVINNIDYKEIDKEDIKKIVSLETLKNIKNRAKKERFNENLKKLIDFLNPLKSYFGILDNLWPIHFLSKNKSLMKPSLKIRECSYILKDNILIIKRTTHKNSTNAGFVSLPKYFIQEYKKISSKNKKDTLREIILYLPKANKVFPFYIRLNEIKIQNETTNTK